jgi:hypothetical protein
MFSEIDIDCSAAEKRCGEYRDKLKGQHCDPRGRSVYRAHLAAL